MSRDLTPDHGHRQQSDSSAAPGSHLLSMVFEAAPQAMMLLDRDGVVTALNGAARILVGDDKPSFSALPCGDVFHCQHSLGGQGCGRNSECPRCPVRTRVMQTFETGLPICNAEGQITSICQGQSVVRDLLLSTSLLKTEPAPLVLLSVMDVTELRRSQEAATNALRESEQRWKFALEGAGDGVWDWNPITNEVFFSARWKSMLGYQEHEIRNHLSEWQARVHPDDLKQIHADLMRHLSGQTPQYVNEHRVRCKDGSWKWVLDSGMVIRRAADGRPERVIGTHKDIDDRKKAEAREAHIKQVLLTIRNINQLITQETDRRRLIEQACKTLTETLGYFNAWIALLDGTGRRATMIASSGLEENFPTLRSRLETGHFPSCMEQALKSHELVTIAAPTMDCPDCPLAREYAGRSGLAQCLAFGDRVYGVVVVSIPEELVRDPEEQSLFSEMAGDLGFALRKIADAEVLQESEQQFRNLFENALDGIALHEMVLDAEGRPVDYIFLQANPAFEKHTGLHVADILGRRVTEVHPGIEKTGLIQVYGQVALTGRPTTFELDFKLAHRHYSVSAYQVNHGRFAVVFEDITERKQTERALRASEEKFAKTFAHAPALMSITATEDGTFLDVNEAFERVSGFSRQEAIGRTSAELGWITPEDRVRLIEALKQDGSVSGMTLPVRSKDGRELICLYHGELIDIAGQSRLLSIGVDVTERALHQKEQEGVLAILGLANTTSRIHEFLQVATGLMQEWSGCEAVGIRLKEGDDFPYFETRGFPPEFVAAENRLCEVDAAGQVLRDDLGNPVLECMCGNILCGRFDPSKPFFTAHGSFWSNGTSELLASTTAADRQARTRNRCNGEGYESVALVPLRIGRTTIGLLQFNDPRSGRLTAATIAMLERLADNLAIALAHCKAEEALAERERAYASLIRDLPGFVYRCRNDRDWTMTYISEGCLAITGYRPEDLLDNKMLSFNDLVLPEYQEPLWQKWQDVLARRGQFEEEYPIRIASGDIRWMWERGQGHFDAAGQLVYLEGYIEDVTMQREAEEQLRLQALVLDQIADNVTVTDLQGTITYVNEAECRSLRHTREELIGQSTMVYGEDATRGATQRQIIASTLAEGHWRGEVANRDANGQEHIMDCRTQVVRDVGGAPIALCGIATDITERKHIESSLREALLWRDTAVTSGHVGLWDWDLITNRVTYSAEWKRQIGYAEHEIGDGFEEWQSRVHPEDLGPTMENIRKVMAGGTEGFHNEFRFRHRDGSYRWILAQASVVFRPDGTLVRMLGTHVDITELRRTEAALEQQHSVIQAVIGSSSEPIFAVDRNYGYTVFNSSHTKVMKALFGKDIAPGMNIIECHLRPEDRRTVQQNLDRALAGEVVRVEHLAGDTRFEQRYFDIVHNPIHDSLGNVTGVAVFGRDLTDRKRLEKQYLQAQKMEAVGRLAAGIAHDFNNQLTVVRGYCDLLMADLQSDDPRWSPLVEIRRAVERSRSTTSHLLSFSRETALQPEIMDLARLLNEIRNPVAKMVGEDIALAVSTAPDLRPVRLDKAMMQQAIMNLIVNARDAMAGGGELTIRAGNVQLTSEEAVRYPGAVAGPYVLLEVIDTGAGMDEETLERIFDPFFTTKDVDKGTGLGLPMVQGFVEQSHGFIRVDSRPAHGTTVSILLPPSAEPAQATVERPPKTPDVSGRPATILVVEDENSVRQTVIQILRKNGYQVIEAACPAEALSLVDTYEGKLDLLISDMVMPGMRGLDLAREIQARRGPLRTLFVTGYLTMEQRGSVQNVLMKPFGIADLLARVRQTLDGA